MFPGRTLKRLPLHSPVSSADRELVFFPRILSHPEPVAACIWLNPRLRRWRNKNACSCCWWRWLTLELLEVTLSAHWAHLVKKAVFVSLLDNWPSFLQPGAVQHVPEPHSVVFPFLHFINYTCSVCVCFLTQYLIFSSSWTSPVSVISLLSGHGAGWGFTVHRQSHRRHPQRGLEKRRQIQPGAARRSAVSDRCTRHFTSAIPQSSAHENPLSCVTGSWSITERKRWHGEVPPPPPPCPITNKESRLPTVKFLSVTLLLLHPMALIENTGDREVCHLQEVWIICKESNWDFTR